VAADEAAGWTTALVDFEDAGDITRIPAVLQPVID
jgi:hypothetical protein